VPDDWFVGFQAGLRAQFWRAASEPWAEQEAAAIAGLLDLPSGGRVLDAPCGSGRIAVRLAERGLEVTGIDISPEEIEAARARGSKATFEVGDLRELPEGAFDAVVQWGNSFGYMPTDATLAALRSAAGALKPGGRLLLESATVAESLLPEYRSELEYEAGGITMRAQHDYDVRNSRLVGDFTFEDAAGRVERAGVIHHVHTVGEVVRMLEGAGFQVEQLLSEAAQRTPYTLGSRHLIAISRI
jgi:SAM-dependent methyltransferase